jgi:hypothetical protein
MGLFAVKHDDEFETDVSAATGKGRAVFFIGAEDSEYGLVGNTAKLLGLREFDRIFDVEKLNFDIIRTLKLDHASMHLMPDNWDRNEMLEPIRDEIRSFAREHFAGKGAVLINSFNLSRTASLWAEEFKKSGIECSFVICFDKPVDNYLNWLVYNLEAEKNSRKFPRAFVHLPDFLNDWRKVMRRTSHDINYDFTNWLSTTREIEIEGGISAKNITILPQEKRTTPLNVKRLYSCLLYRSDAADDM